MRRSFAHWRLYVTLLQRKREAVRKAALKCFAMYSQQVWIGWRHLARLSAKLRAAQAARKVCRPMHRPAPPASPAMPSDASFAGGTRC